MSTRADLQAELDGITAELKRRRELPNGQGYVIQQQNESHSTIVESTSALQTRKLELIKLLGVSPRARRTKVIA